MRYFTPDLLARFGSEDEVIALAAQEEWEQRAEIYDRGFRAIEGRLPGRFRELCRRFYLHDAVVLGIGSRQAPDLAGTADTGQPVTSIPPPPGVSVPDPIPLYRITLRLDPPPHEVVTLDYRAARIELAPRGESPPEYACPALEWLYDEVELPATARGSEFGQSILFTNGWELRLTFADFDFAVAEPARRHSRAVGA